MSLPQRKTIGCTEVVAVVFKKRDKNNKENPLDKILLDLWRAENDARQAEGLPPISFKLWYYWYSQRHGDGQGGGNL